jgi:hypothetical protein
MPLTCAKQAVADVSDQDSERKAAYESIYGLLIER